MKPLYSYAMRIAFIRKMHFWMGSRLAIKKPISFLYTRIFDNRAFVD